jgi:hypothetical protein
MMGFVIQHILSESAMRFQQSAQRQQPTTIIAGDILTDHETHGIVIRGVFDLQPRRVKHATS